MAGRVESGTVRAVWTYPVYVQGWCRLDVKGRAVSDGVGWGGRAALSQEDLPHRTQERTRTAPEDGSSPSNETSAGRGSCWREVGTCGVHAENGSGAKAVCSV
ncbi:hypothetical protein PF010_g20914 [Phytophthora fragariae]|uniref:Uncharacterized protein n=1 Tax=Phytophthora fragariae TaxID=53985 RepID=A0A6G0KCU1_9STRA|nr:hypothetical protein PF010_g20914 [Phytophthora fragariae]